MKYLGAICALLACLVAYSSAADPETPFTQIIAEAQAHALQLHVDFEDQFDAMRTVVSEHLSEISAATLTRLLDATQQTQQQAIRCSAIPSITLQITQLSAQISQCALQTDQRITELSSNYFDSLVRPQGASVALLSAVLDYVSRSNPVDAPDQIAADMANALRALRTEFDVEMLPAVQATVAAIGAAVLSVPQFTRDCVNNMLEQVHFLANDCEQLSNIQS